MKDWWRPIGAIVGALGLFFTVIILPIQTKIDSLEDTKIDTVQHEQSIEHVKEKVSDLKEDNKEDHTEMKADIKEILRELRKLNGGGE